MKKAINKGEREEILTALVCAASARKAQDIVDSLSAIRKELHSALLGAWQDTFPGISRQDQLELLRTYGAQSLTFKPAIYTQGKEADSKKTAGEFGRIEWNNSSVVPISTKERIARLASRIYQNCTGTSGVLTENITSGYTSAMYLNRTFTDIINGTQPSALYDASLDVPDPIDRFYNDILLDFHVKVTAQLSAFRSLVDQAEDAYQKLGAAIAPVKTAAQLADLMPEAVKFFPASLTYVKPTKEIADPKAINEIRAKLKKGLPI